MKLQHLLIALACIYFSACSVENSETENASASTEQSSSSISQATDLKKTYNPLAYALETKKQVYNREAVIPPQCYTKTDSQFNPCWTCHTREHQRNVKGDWVLQTAYAFSDEGLTNQWKNLFTDFSDVTAEISDKAMLDYIRQDNYNEFKAAMQHVTKYAGWRPDVDLDKGFDKQGFALDGSGWRSFRYKPFLGTFWPTNGATDDVFIRLAKKFYTDIQGNQSKEIYKINLAILEAALTHGPIVTPDVNRVVEPLNEKIAGIDLNGDGQLTENITTIKRLPKFYVGAAHEHPVKNNLYPKHTEFLHTVRYLDPKSPNWLSKRIKEVRYSRKTHETDDWSLSRFYEHEVNSKENDKLPLFKVSPTTGIFNEASWKLQAWIEDEHGRLRTQTDQEHYFCMGCHSNIGVTVDQTFSFARKVPGKSGWGIVNLAGIPDVPQLGHNEPEILTYFKRAGGGDEYRNNTEILERFFPEGKLNEEEILRASASGDKDMRYLVLPTQKRAYALNKAYMALVKKQRFDLGRDPMLTPPKNVHQKITEISAGLPADKIFQDGVLWLDWSGTEFVMPNTVSSSQ